MQQLFDVSADPSAKQLFLSGDFNRFRCPFCGYEGTLSLPLIYHDPDKELLLTYFPPELGASVNDQERAIGPLINQVISRLPPEKRKAYLLQPQTMLTLQSMLEKILAADGITHEMIEEQQKRLQILQRLLSTTGDERASAIAEEDASIDESLFAILSQLVQAAATEGDRAAYDQFNTLQADLLANSTFGKQLDAQTREAQEALRTLQEASEGGLTREKLLDLFIQAPNDERIAALTSLAHSALDYPFFQMLSERIDGANADERQRLIDLRNKMLQFSEEIERQEQARQQAAAKVLDSILAADDIQAAVEKNLPAIDDAFTRQLNARLDAARKAGDLEQSTKLGNVLEAVQKLTTPPEIELIQNLIQIQDEETLKATLEQNKGLLTDEFFQMLNSLIAEMENRADAKDLQEALQRILRLALRTSMHANLVGGN
jgi:hypothetical protein